MFAEADPQKRGYKFESFLNELFHIHGLAPRSSFRVAGEQIDGSFEWNGNTFMVEARWRAQPANAADLLVLRGKAEKSDWTRGLTDTKVPLFSRCRTREDEAKGTASHG